MSEGRVSLASYVLRRKCRAETQGQDRCASLPTATGGGVCGAATLAKRQGLAVLQNIITKRACTGFRNHRHTVLVLVLVVLVVVVVVVVADGTKQLTRTEFIRT